MVVIAAIRHRAARAVSVAVALLLMGPAAASALVLPSNAPATNVVPNGPVRALAAAGDTLYVGGDFTQIGPATGPGIAVDATTGARDARFPALDGEVDASIGDGSGGWYVGGSFGHAGTTVAPRLVHLLADGSVDPSFNAPATFARVYSLALDPVAHLLYVGASGSARLVRLNASTGALDAGWNPAPNGYVHSIALDAAHGRLYAAGGFTVIGSNSLARVGVALVHTSDDQALTTFSANTTDINDHNAAAQTVVLGSSYVYIAGGFSKVAGAAHAWTAQLDPATGAPTGWAPDPDGYTSAIAADDAHGKVYLGGMFVNAGGAAHRGLARVSNSTGTADAWRADTDGYPGNAGAAKNVADLRLSGSTLYVVGAFDSIEAGSGPVTRHGAAALDVGAAAPVVTPWDPEVGVNTDAGYTAYTVATQAGAAYIGGNFPIAGGSPRSALAALDARTGALLSFSHDFTGDVDALAVANGRLYAGGGFSAVDGHPQNRVAAFGLGDGALVTDFAPPASIGGVVRALLAVNERLYAGGSMAGDLVALSPATGATLGGVVPWIDNGQVEALAASGGLIYAGGSFTYTGLSGLMAFDANGTPAGGFTPILSTGTDVRALHVDGGVVYAGGSFTSPRVNLAAFNATSGAWMSGWTPPWASFSGSAGVYGLFGFGGKIWAVGKPTAVLGTPAAGDGGLGILDPVDGSPTSGFYPGFDQDVEAAAIAGGRFWVGGMFDLIGGALYQGPLASFAFPAPAATTAPVASGTPQPGQTLGCTTGTWSNEPTSFTYQWLRDGTAIAGAVSTHHVVAASDGGHSLGCRVTATADSGARGTATSNVLAVPAPPPVETSPAGSGSGGGGQPTGGGGTIDTTVSFTLTRVRTLRPDARGRVALKVSCKDPNRCTGTITVVAARREHVRPRLGGIAFKLAAGRHPTLALKLTKKARALLARRRTIKVVVTASVHDGAGNRRTIRRTATLAARREHAARSAA